MFLSHPTTMHDFYIPQNNHGPPPRKWRCLKDVFPLQCGDFQVPDASFSGMYSTSSRATNNFRVSASSSHMFFLRGGVFGTKTRKTNAEVGSDQWGVVLRFLALVGAVMYDFHLESLGFRILYHHRNPFIIDQVTYDVTPNVNTHFNPAQTKKTWKQQIASRYTCQFLWLGQLRPLGIRAFDGRFGEKIDGRICTLNSVWSPPTKLGGGFGYFSFSPLPGEMIQSD